MPPQHTNSQNSIISCRDVDFHTKIFLVLYPTLENSTTRINLQCLVLDLFLLCTIRILLLLLHVDPTNILECIEIKVHSYLLSYCLHMKLNSIWSIFLYPHPPPPPKKKNKPTPWLTPVFVLGKIQVNHKLC